MPIHVSLHDVSPASADEVELIVAEAARFAIRPALLVVPNFHRRSKLRDHPRFVERLMELQSLGHEIYLHGYHHLAGHEGQPNGGGSPTNHGLAWLWHQRVVSGGEAEFADLSRREALHRLEQGAAELTELGLTLDGFVPPAWSMPRWLIPILAARGFRYTEDHLWVIDPVSGRRQLTLLLNYATRSRSRMLATAAYCRAVSPLATLGPTRFAIHPNDYRVSLLRRQIEHLLERFAPFCVAKGEDLFGETSTPLGSDLQTATRTG
jgi:predicted deacetylase